MANDPRDVINPLHLDTVVAGSVSAITSDTFPGVVMIKAQVMRPPRTSPDTILLHIDQSDARLLHTTLSNLLNATSN